MFFGTAMQAIRIVLALLVLETTNMVKVQGENLRTMTHPMATVGSAEGNRQLDVKCGEYGYDCEAPTRLHISNVALGPNLEGHYRDHSSSDKMWWEILGKVSSYDDSLYIDIDLGSTFEIHEVILWHYYEENRQYYSQTVEISADGTFNGEQHTVYSTGKGKVGPVESAEGNLIRLEVPVAGRFVRHRCGRSTKNDRAHFFGVAVFGRKARLRFSKIKWQKDVIAYALYRHILPLTALNYPIHHHSNTYYALQQSSCPSVVVPDDYEVHHDVVEMIAMVGGYPSHPEYRSDEFWHYFRSVLAAQLYRRSNGHELGSTIMELPALWKSFTIDEVAEAVHDEYPGMHQSNFLASIASSIEIDNDIIPQRCKTQFLHGIVLLSFLNTWSVNMVGSSTFAAKYFVGRVRPEEIAWLIETDELTASDGVPKDIIRDVKSMKLSRAEDFSAYDEGCPNHPAWPAMHSAASSVSLWLAVVANLTDDQWHQAKLTDFAVAFGRTVAGVHYVDDNVAGLNMGQEIVARELPRWLADMFGADEGKVAAKVNSVRFDWNVAAGDTLFSGFDQ